MKGNRTVLRYLAMDDSPNGEAGLVDSQRRRRPDPDEADDFDHRHTSTSRNSRSPSPLLQEKSR